MADAVNLRNLRRTYGAGGGAVRALDDVSVDFAAGSFTAIMGPSGSGKSTLLQCAAGLDRPDSGQVLLDGQDLSGMRERELTLLRRTRIGFVFQSFNLLPSLSAEQNVGLPIRLAGGRPDRDAVRAALADVRLADRAGHRPGELSGGQQQRVAIARALVMRPTVLFADEPTGALDSTSSREVLALLRAMVDDGGQTVVMVTHDPLAAASAHRVVFLADGKVAGELNDPTPEDIAHRMTRLETAPC
jgi:putative ABC transport system ATP-binding protein